MALFTNSPNMLLPIPSIGVDPGPDYATNINNCLTLVDGHDHTPGRGVQLTPASFNINSDLAMNNNNLTLIRASRFQVQPSLLNGSADIGELYVSGVDLYYNDVNGNQVRITQSGAVAGTPGSIANLVAPASASYVSANQTFVFQSAANTPANIDGASYILRNLVANSHSLTLNPPNAMGADYSITLPTLPSTQSFLTIDAAGNMGAPIAYPLSGLTGSAFASNVNLPGKFVQEGGLNVVVSNTNDTQSLAIVRGVVLSTGSIDTGVGFSVAHPSTGIYNITITAGFNDRPAITATYNSASGAFSPNGFINVLYPQGNTFQVQVFASNGNAVDATFSFIAIGQRV